MILLSEEPGAAVSREQARDLLMAELRRAVLRVVAFSELCASGLTAADVVEALDGYARELRGALAALAVRRGGR